MGGLESTHSLYLTLQICHHAKSTPHSKILEWGNFLLNYRQNHQETPQETPQETRFLKETRFLSFYFTQ